MRAVVHDRYGEPEDLYLRELPEPRITDRECLIKVTAVSVNPSDWKTLAGWWSFATGRRFPRQTGIDFSGTIERTGRKVTRFRVGEAVMGSVIPLRKGCLAEYVAVAESHLCRIPKNVALPDAAGIPVACSTAYVGLRHRRKDLQGKRVLLIGGGGGVGHFVIQLGRVFGAHITAVCSEGKMELCRELGADRVLDYGQADPLESGGSYDLVFNCASSISYPQARRILNTGGEYLLLETQGRLWLFAYSLFSQITPSRRLWAFLVSPDGERYNRLAELFEENDLKVVVGSRYPMEKAAEAFRESKNGHATGKIIIDVAQ
ncbi:MAG: NAD(P)-dependent alcohol dehydrogenase [Spirochaetaceae bacterium]|nr:MAG: NAD(P)-dependent alcohol dehydrogenase [Spirochaetaceae bacterium]